MKPDSRRGLRAAVESDVPFRQVLDRLREYKALGITRREVQGELESLRASAPNEAAEDRILEVLDFVSGFCTREQTIWED